MSLKTSQEELPRKEHGASNAVGLGYAAVWLIFLSIPVIAIANSGAGIPVKVICWAATVAFAWVYLMLMGRWMPLVDQGRHPALRQILSWLGLLALLAAVTVPAIETYATAYTPYMAALVIFSYPPRVGIPWGLLLWGVPTTAALIYAALREVLVEGAFWAVLGPGIGVIFIIVIRLQEYVESRDRSRDERLRQAEERDRIARDVHDVLGHSLTVLSIKAQLARRMLDVDPGRAKHELEQIDKLARESLGQVRSTVTRLRSPRLDGEIEAARIALESAEITADITVNNSQGTSGQAPEDPTGLLAWALREGVTNVVRHAEAQRCLVEIQPGFLRVADDGNGIDLTLEGNGLRGLRERAEQAGARLRIGQAHPELNGTSTERPGTSIEVSL